MTTITPNDTPVAATVDNASATDQSIYEKMTAMREMTQRNQIRGSQADETGVSAEANTESPVAPEPEITSDEDSRNIDLIDEDTAPTDTVDPDAEPAEGTEEEVSTPEANSTAEELIDFIEFAETNPNAKFKFMRNGKEVIIDAKRAASILGQGGAIHEEARQLKIERAEFNEYLKEQRAQQEGLTLAMEFTVQPKLQQAYDEIVKTQGYQTTFQQQLAQTQDPAQQARIRASMEQNERYIAQQGQLIQQLKPAVDQFKEVRRQQVTQILEQNRRSFKDKELKNEFVYNELRDKLSKTWQGATNELVPGVKNLDLVSSDETLMGLVRDGLKYRDRPQAKQAGSSIAALTTRKQGSTPNVRAQEDNINALRERAKGGDKKAADNLLMQQLSRLRSARGGR